MLTLEIPVLSPLKRGHLHGETFKQQIRELAKIRKDLLLSFLKGWSPEKLNELLGKNLDSLRKYPELYDEFQGICEASHTSHEDLMILNNYTDLRDFSGREQAPKEEGCSAFALLSPEHNLSGQTWDMHASALPYTLHLKIQRKDAAPLEVLTLTGCLGLCGLNPEGFAVYINNMHCLETRAEGLMWPGLVRLMLEKSQARDAQAVLENHIPCSGHSYLLVDTQRAINIETTGVESDLTQEVSRQDGKAILHTNHYVGRLKAFEIMKRQSPSTHARLAALENFLQTADWKKSSNEKLVRGLLEEGACAQAINVAKPKDPHAGMTCGGLWVDMKARKARFFSGVYQDRDFSDLSF